jgi:hypothetical protein
LITPPQPGQWYVTLPAEAHPYSGCRAGPFATDADARAWLLALPFIRGAVVWEQAPGAGIDPMPKVREKEADEW